MEQLFLGDFRMFSESKERKATVLDKRRIYPLCDDGESEKKIVKELTVS